MPGFIGNYKLPSVNTDNTIYNTLACKLVTAFDSNASLEPPLPSILANIFLLDSNTGRLKCIIEATEITAWRTAAASMVSTKYLYIDRKADADSADKLSIVGCGVEVSVTICFINRFGLLAHFFVI